MDFPSQCVWASVSPSRAWTEWQEERRAWSCCLTGDLGRWSALVLDGWQPPILLVLRLLDAGASTSGFLGSLAFGWHISKWRLHNRYFVCMCYVFICVCVCACLYMSLRLYLSTYLSPIFLENPDWYSLHVTRYRHQVEVVEVDKEEGHGAPCHLVLPDGQRPPLFLCGTLNHTVYVWKGCDSSAGPANQELSVVWVLEGSSGFLHHTISF